MRTAAWGAVSAIVAAGFVVLIAVLVGSAGGEGEDGGTLASARTSEVSVDSVSRPPTDTPAVSTSHSAATVPSRRESAQEQVADMLLDALGKLEEVRLDEGCIRGKASQLSDADAEAIVAAGPDGDPQVSPAADAIADSLFECVDIG